MFPRELLMSFMDVLKRSSKISVRERERRRPVLTLRCLLVILMKQHVRQCVVLTPAHGLIMVIEFVRTCVILSLQNFLSIFFNY